MAIAENPAFQAVSFQVDGRLLGLDIRKVREIRGWQQETPIPGASDSIRGVIDLRGEAIPVHDMKTVLGLGRTDATPTHVCLIVELEQAHIGLLADSVSDILDIPAGGLKPPPGDDAGLVTGLAMLDGGIVALVEPAHIAGSH